MHHTHAELAWPEKQGKPLVPLHTALLIPYSLHGENWQLDDLESLFRDMMKEFKELEEMKKVPDYHDEEGDMKVVFEFMADIEGKVRSALKLLRKDVNGEVKKKECSKYIRDTCNKTNELFIELSEVRGALFSPV